MRSRGARLWRLEHCLEQAVDLGVDPVDYLSKVFRIINKVQMDGDTLDVLGQGMLDFRKDTVSAELLASPFKTVDTLVKNIPGINYLMGGSLVAIPVSVKGKQNDPKVRIMSASSVGSSLLSLGERVIKSPLKLIETVTPD